MRLLLATALLAAPAWPVPRLTPLLEPQYRPLDNDINNNNNNNDNNNRARSSLESITKSEESSDFLLRLGLESPASDKITFEEFINGNFSYKTFNGSWWSDTELQWKNKEGDLVTWNLDTNETKTLVHHDLLTSFSEAARFKGFSPDKRLLLFASDISRVWRHSYTARYVVYDPATDTATTVTDPEGGETLQHCAWVENSEAANTLLYVSGNNMYWRRLGGDEADISITDSGAADRVFNGVPDWVYEEEVLFSSTAHYLNTPGDLVAYAQFNDTLVKEFQYPVYGDESDVFSAQYPEHRVVRYPKAGQTNPALQLKVWSSKERVTKVVEPPTEVAAWGEFIYTIADWTEDRVLSVTWMNRVQNESVTSRCEESSEAWRCSGVFSQRQQDGWIEIMAPPVYSSQDPAIFLQILPSKQTEDGLSYPHLARVDTSSQHTTFLTSGPRVVRRILAWDQDNTGLVYLLGTAAGRPGSLHLYTVPAEGGDIRCVTCELVTSRGEQCARSSVSMNPGTSHYVHTCLGQGVPESVLRRTSDHALVHVFEDNSELEDKLAAKLLPRVIETSVPIAGGRFAAPVRILAPPRMQAGARYPVVVHVYGGPGYQKVKDAWSLGWAEHLATTRDIVYVIMDTRGTGGQSNEFLFSVYRNLGTVEMEDEIAVTRSLVASHAFMDPARVAIWGWSYGGFNTAMTLERDQGVEAVFKCGIAVAPVSSWLLYDSIYTERYMALPSDNTAGYNNSLIANVDNLRTKQLMVHHGVADDNVHYQHTMLLTKALQQADIQYEEHAYPDQNHALRGVSSFLYHSMDSFWRDCFQLVQ